MKTFEVTLDHILANFKDCEISLSDSFRIGLLPVPENIMFIFVMELCINVASRVSNAVSCGEIQDICAKRKRLMLHGLSARCQNQ